MKLSPSLRTCTADQNFDGGSKITTQEKQSTKSSRPKKIITKKLQCPKIVGQFSYRERKRE